MNELRLALRALRKRPLFTAIAAVTLALGIGATTTLFTIVNAVLLRPLPYPEANRIVSISESEDRKDGQVVAAPDYFEWVRSAHSFEGLAAYGPTAAVLTGRDEPARLYGGQVSVRFFSIFGAHPTLGRTFRPEEAAPTGPGVVILAHDLWRQQFGGDPAVLGRTISLDGKPYTVIGVMPVRFAVPRGAQYWVPEQRNLQPGSGTVFFVEVVGRLKAGVDLAGARAELSALSRRVGRLPSPMATGETAREAVVLTLHDRMFGSARPALLMLLGAVGFLLLIACANVANLLLARAIMRQKEFAVRVALGAGRWRLARELLWESVVVGGLGGAFGLLIPLGSLAYFVRVSPASVARVENIHLDGTVLAFTAAVSLLTGLLFGLVPAVTATRPGALRALQEGGARTTGTVGQRRMRQALVVAELAVALLLLTGAGLLTRSFARAVAVDVGFDSEDLLTVDVGLTPSRYPDERSAMAFFERVAEQIRALPGVRSVGYTDAPPLAGYRMVVRFPMAGGGEMSPPLAVVRTSPDYLKAFGAQVVEGRLFNHGDRAGAPPVVLLSTSAAGAIFHNRPVVGQTLPIPVLGPGHQTVVGVVKDFQEPGSDTPRLPQVYQPIAQAPDHPAALAIRYAGDAIPLKAGIRRIVAGLDPLQPVYAIATMQEEFDRIVAPRRFNSLVIGVFAALALVLAAVGLYGVVAYQVAQRTQELGIRMALGADRGRVLRFVLRDGMTPALLGTACGIALSLAFSRLLTGMLFGVTPHDLCTFTVVPAVLVAVAIGACYLPARRATKVDPVVALRHE